MAEKREVTSATDAKSSPLSTRATAFSIASIISSSEDLKRNRERSSESESHRPPSSSPKRFKTSEDEEPTAQSFESDEIPGSPEELDCAEMCLEGRELWGRFNELGTEMIITKSGSEQVIVTWLKLWRKSKQITRLKIDSNPFAKGFRDTMRIIPVQRECSSHSTGFSSTVIHSSPVYIPVPRIISPTLIQTDHNSSTTLVRADHDASTILFRTDHDASPILIRTDQESKLDSSCCQSCSSLRQKSAFHPVSVVSGSSYLHFSSTLAPESRLCLQTSLLPHVSIPSTCIQPSAHSNSP
ncbi:predicted protein [Nematostella vectensis]|uniref:T-box domain-containing protein n=1 Tax=Nematostella vectensis TaxID=45351 RepID=A7T0F9_NEMVE|nr:predicted protein [Nematostella vectensis]|eukprot:XP_001622659.1 predicted protein [Nematostella vectensis]